MPLLGTVAADRPLLVVATREETVHLPAGIPVLLTGIGKINATLALTAALHAGIRPAEIINLGTAGALRPGWTGVLELAPAVAPWPALSGPVWCRPASDRPRAVPPAASTNARASTTGSRALRRRPRGGVPSRYGSPPAGGG